MGQLQPIDLVSFTGGLNVRRNPLVLGDTESPDMLNIEVDPRGGFYTRKGWQRWNPDDIAVDPAEWNPRLGKMHPLSSGSFEVYVANNDGTGYEVWTANPAAAFTLQPVVCDAAPHGADFAAWGDTMYMACGSVPSWKRDETATAVILGDADGNWNNDYTQPVGGYMPRSDYIETHSGYVFTAGTNEGGAPMPNRLRWSHPNFPEDWAETDFLDIERGGGRITGLMSFQDHLVIFKTDSIWALYGYDLDSWQLINVSTSVGIPSIQAVARSESAIYFYSSSGEGGVYGYAGGSPVSISEAVLPIMERITLDQEVWLGWVGKRLWCSIPFEDNTVLIFDPDVGEGAWLKHRCALGSVGPIVSRSDVSVEFPLAAINGNSGASCLVYLDYRDDSFDVILGDYATHLTDSDSSDTLTDETDGSYLTDGASPLGSPFEAYYRTGWQTAGWPERRKSWRRPRFISQVSTSPVPAAVRASVFWDYNRADARRTSLGYLSAETGAVWGAFTWGDGTLWGGANVGSEIRRVSSGLGVSRAMQIEVRSDPSTPGAAWGIDALHFHYILRRYTT